MASAEVTEAAADGGSAVWGMDGNAAWDFLLHVFGIVRAEPSVFAWPGREAQ